VYKEYHYCVYRVFVGGWYHTWNQSEL